MSPRIEAHVLRISGSTAVAQSEKAPDRRCWWPASLLIVLLLLPVAFVSLDTYQEARRNTPSEDELKARFFAHEAVFERLAKMLAADRPVASEEDEVVDLPTLARFGIGPVRANAYKDMLREIAATDMRYFRKSGRVILLVDAPRSIFARSVIGGSSRSYWYQPDGAPQPVIEHHGYSSWRGPGMRWFTGNQPLAGGWFIHSDVLVAVAFSPY